MRNIWAPSTAEDASARATRLKFGIPRRIVLVIYAVSELGMPFTVVSASVAILTRWFCVSGKRPFLSNVHGQSAAKDL